MHSNNYRSVIPTDTQALTALQKLISDDFQVKNTHSTQRKGEETPDTRSELQDEDIPTDPEDPQCNSKKSNGIFKGSIRYISIKTNSTDSRQVLQSISNSTKRINILNPLIH